MNGSTVAFILEFGLIFGSAIGFGVWQLWSLKKLKRKRETKDAADHAGSEN